VSEETPRRSPRSILFVHHRPELGGAPQSLSYLIQELDRTRYEPHVYCPPGPAAESFRQAGATVHTGAVSTFTHIWASTYNGRRWVLFGRELVSLPAHIRDFRKTLRRNRFDLIHLNDSPLIPAGVMARRAGLPVVWHLRSAFPHGGHDIRSRVLRRIYRKIASASIAINDDVAGIYSIGSHIVPNTVDLEQFRPGNAREAKEVLGIPVGRPAIAFFGFIYPSKGFRDFIQAAALLRERGVDALFLVVGGAVRGQAFFNTFFGRSLQLLDLVRNYEATAKQMVAELGLDEHISFVPFTRNPALLYRAADVVVAPSRGPELGRPVIEASACGRAIVASGSIGGGGVIVPGETGYLVPRRSPDVLAAALQELIENDELRNRLGENARRHAQANFDPARNAARVMDIYDAVLAGRP